MKRVRAQIIQVLQDGANTVVRLKVRLPDGEDVYMRATATPNDKTTMTEIENAAPEI